MAKNNGQKRAHGEGSVYKRENGTWRAQIMIGRDADGKKRMKSFSGATQAEVLRNLRTFQKLRDANILAGNDYPFNAWADHWYKGHESQVAPSTYSGYQYTLAILKKEFGRTLIEDILPMHVMGFLTRLAVEGASRSKITKCRAMLIQIFDDAVENSLLLRNPARTSKRIMTQETDDENGKDAFTQGEIDILFAELPWDMLGNSVRLLIVTGMRVQELLALTADDIADDGSSIRITKAVKMVDGKAVLGPPKSKASKREIPVPQPHRAIALYLRQNGSTPFLWKSGRVGRPYSVGAFRDRYYAAIDLVSGVRRLPPHCCRHTYVTMLQSKGVSMELIARLAGHKDIKITDKYLHVSADTLQDAVEVLNHV